MKDLLKEEAVSIPAQQAIELFCYSAKKYVGALSAILGGLDSLVFTGGIGENSPIVRKRICEGLEYLGCTVSTIHTDENLMMVRNVFKLLG